MTSILRRIFLRETDDDPETRELYARADEALERAEKAAQRLQRTLDRRSDPIALIDDMRRARSGGERAG